MNLGHKRTNVREILFVNQCYNIHTKDSKTTASNCVNTSSGSEWKAYMLLRHYVLKRLKRLKLCIALHGKPISELRGVTCHMGSHPTQVNAPALTRARQAGTRFTYPGGMEGWVDLGSLIAARPGFELTTAWSQVQRPIPLVPYTTKTPPMFERFVSKLGTLLTIFDENFFRLNWAQKCSEAYAANQFLANERRSANLLIGRRIEYHDVSMAFSIHRHHQQLVQDVFSVKCIILKLLKNYLLYNPM